MTNTTFTQKGMFALNYLLVTFILGCFFVTMLGAHSQSSQTEQKPDWQKDLLLKYNFFYESGEWNFLFTVGNKNKSVAYGNVQLEIVWPGMQIPEIVTLTDSIAPRKSIRFSEKKPGPPLFANKNQSDGSNLVNARIIGAEPELGDNIWQSLTGQDKGLNPDIGGKSQLDQSSEVLLLADNQKPKVLKGVRPKYPAVALRARIRGTVIIEVTIDENGVVKAATIIQGQPLLNQDALNAVRKWIFEPYEVDDIPTPVRFNVQVTFELTR